ncbi:hypothetical protein FH972_009298 [Carpinus fangiana]|uniref:Uncharacterized protein n=1 Tax=Carpinus fangiana TaxID=176857 RepID=A0A5N6R1F2_9ROSI|nr:hypothetical protein FH972_009298 [Carpinus fangiana]
MYNRLKKSLAKTLTRFYPLAGKINGGASVEFHDETVIFVRAHASIHLSKILENPDLNSLKQLLPLNPYKLNANKPVPITMAQLNAFSCSEIGVDVHHEITSVDLVAKEKTVTKRFVFDVTNLATLKAKAAAKGLCVDNPTCVEAVTALISMSAKNATRGKSLQGRSSMVIIHVVNLRAQTVPPLPEHAFGNIWQLTIAPIVEVENKTEWQDLAVQLRRAIRKIDDNYVKKLQGEDGLHQASESMKEVLDIASKGEVEFYTFSSWVGLPFYETDFG